MKAWVVISMLLMGIFSSAEAKEEVVPYEYVQYITTDLQPGTVYQFPVTPEIFDGCKSFPRDLQVMGAGGISWPYAVHESVPSHNLTVLPSRKISDGTVSNQVDVMFVEYQLFPSRLSSRGLSHNQVTVRTSGASFRRKATLWQRYTETQDWKPLGGGTLMNFGEGTAVGLQRISYAPSRAPFLRVEVHADPAIDQDIVKVLKVNVGFADNNDRYTEWMALPSLNWSPAERLSSRPGWSEMELDTGFRSLPVERMVFEIANETFSRAVQIHGRNNSSNSWRKVGDHAIYRLGGQEQIEIRLRHCRYRWLKIESLDREQGPLKIEGIRAYHVPRTVYFQAYGAGKGLLRYGSLTHRNANPALNDRLAASDPLETPVVELSDRVAVSTFTERKKMVRPLTYGLVSLLGGTVIVIVLLRRMLL